LFIYNSNTSNIISNVHYTDPEVEAAVLRYSFSGLPKTIKASLLFPSLQFLEQWWPHSTGLLLYSVQQAKLASFSWNLLLKLHISKSNKNHTNKKKR